MKTIASLGSGQVMCPECKTRYDLSKAVRRAELKRERKVKCPACGYEVGTVN